MFFLFFLYLKRHFYIINLKRFMNSFEFTSCLFPSNILCYVTYLRFLHLKRIWRRAALIALVEFAVGFLTPLPSSQQPFFFWLRKDLSVSLCFYGTKMKRDTSEFKSEKYTTLTFKRRPVTAGTIAWSVHRPYLCLHHGGPLGAKRLYCLEEVNHTFVPHPL